MLPKFSVKKPYTVVVAVVMIIVLGVISFTGMTTDLLPAIELPYIVVATSYPGASPEKVELAVTKPLESVLGTTSGIKSVSSTSNENSSMVMLEFEQGTNMDSATIELSGNIDLVSAQLPDGVGAPMLMKISPDMLPIMVASVDVNGMDIKEVSSYVTNTVLPALERIDGVASVNTQGLIKEQLTITLNQSKIDALNDKVLENVDKELAKAQKELRDGKAKITDGQKKVAEGKTELTTKKDDAVAKMSAGSAQLDSAVANLNALLAEETTINADKAAFEAEQKGYTQVKTQYEALNTQLAAMQIPGMSLSISMLAAMDEAQFNAFIAMAGAALPPEMAAQLNRAAILQLEGAYAKAQERLPQIKTELNNMDTRLAVLSAMKPELQKGLEKATAGYEELEKGKLVGMNELTKAEVTLSSTEKELETAAKQMEDAEKKLAESSDEAYKKAGLSGVITSEMLSNILKAQNFAMPAGYIKDGDTKTLVKVGDALGSEKDTADILLMNMDIDGVGDVRLSDVADIEMTDNSKDSYAKINGNDGVVFTIQKQSTASTATVSNRIADAINSLQQSNNELHITPLMDQGDYIDMIIESVLQNLVIGGLLAIFVLALFLKDFKPTAIVACSIPLSLMFAVTLMYFSGITLNIISLSGLALGVGMLVDNSIVVIENVYRLRSEGMPATRAAVKGASQVAGAIFASTLTTVCVFLPIVFTQGLSRQLFTDMGLTIAYSLLASLIIALTFVPAMGATVLRNTKEKTHKWFDAFVRAYEKVLSFSLKHKAPALIAVILLLVFSVAMIGTMGTAFIPEMESPQMSVTLKMPKDTKNADAYVISDKAIDKIMAIDGVDTVGAMSGGGMMGMSTGDAKSGISISAYVLLDTDTKRSNADIAKEIREVTRDLSCEVSVQESSMNMSALGGSGIEIVVDGYNIDELNKICADLRNMLGNIDGIVDVSQPPEANAELRVTVNKDKAMREGLTVAQIYSELSSAIKTETNATTLSAGDKDYAVVIISTKENSVTKDNLAEYEFTVKDKDGKDKIVRLSDIASINMANGVKAINRASGTRTMSVTAGVDAQHNIGIVGREVQSKIDEMQLASGYSAKLMGENESINSSMLDLVKMISLAIVFIYLIMVAQFQSLLSPFIVMFTIPLAFTGGLLALLITGMPISIIAMLGFLVLAGVVVNNGIVFVDYINQLRLEGMDKREAIIATGKARVRPVLMTALTTILAMSTMALGIGSGAEMSQPLAIVTIGGLTYATVLTLVIVPILYDIFHRKPMKQIDIGEDD
ncbi:MAG: efflux RND transporter permease subunit [Oscillospiraceae bacterium]